MPFTILVLVAAFLIESIGTYVSVLGLASLFSANIIIIGLAVALDLGKVVSVSFLYKYWGKVNLLMKSYMTVAAMVLMLITSAGAFGFLSSEFQKAISGTNTQNVVLQALTDEQGRLQKRKEEIDAQIAKLPDNSVRGRTQLIRQFGPEVNRLNTRLAEIDKELPALKVDAIKKNVEVGPIIFIAESFNTTPEKAVKWVIFIIIFVFDPLAIALLLAGNFLLEQRKKEKEEASKTPAALIAVEPDPIKEEVPEVIEQAELVQELAPIEEAKPETIVQPLIEEEMPEVLEEKNDLVILEEPAYISEPPVEVVEPHTFVEEVLPQVDESLLTTVEEPAAEEPAHFETMELVVPDKAKEEEREVITIEMLTTPYRSSLESIDISKSDVEEDSDIIRRDMKNINKLYNSHSAG